MLKISIEKRHLHLDRRVPHTTKNFQTKREPPPIFLPYILTIYIYTWEENRTDRWSYRGFNYYQESSETTRRGKNCEIIRRNNTAKTHHSTHKLPSRDANRCTDIYIYIHTHIHIYIYPVWFQIHHHLTKSILSFFLLFLFPLITEIQPCHNSGVCVEAGGLDASFTFTGGDRATGITARCTPHARSFVLVDHASEGSATRGGETTHSLSLSLSPASWKRRYFFFFLLLLFLPLLLLRRATLSLYDSQIRTIRLKPSPTDSK